MSVFSSVEATRPEKRQFAHDMAVAYMSHQDLSGLSSKQYLDLFQKTCSEIYREIKDLQNPYTYPYIQHEQ